MLSDRLFLDTSYIIARFNRRDQYHKKSKEIGNVVATAREPWTTEAVLFEVAAAFSEPRSRPITTSIWDEFHGGDSRCRAREAAGARLAEAVELFRQRSDKAWSLTDCFSFVVMDEEQITDALAADHHFE